VADGRGADAKARRGLRGQVSRHWIRAAELLVPQRPAPWTAGGLCLLAAVLTSLFVATLEQTSAPRPAIAWTLSGLCGTTVFVVGVWLLAAVLRQEHFGPGISWSLALRVYGGYAIVGAAAALVEREIRAELVLPIDRHALALTNHVVWYWLVGVAANAFAVLRRRVGEQDVALRDRVRDLDRTRALLARADERVRRDAAEVLHGRVQSRLLASQVRIERAIHLLATDPGAATAELADVAAVLDDLRVNDVRFTSHQLHPPTIRISLMSALRSLIATFEGSFAVDVDLRTAAEVTALDDPTAGALDEPTRLVLYRVLEEALQNSYRHGRATSVHVDLSVLPGARIQLSVTDNGVGFSPDDFTIGLGVASLAARVEDQGGAWWISSSPGAGTTLTAVVPLPPARVDGGPPSRTSGGTDLCPPDQTPIVNR
jgi:signal transduction histidine kinase